MKALLRDAILRLFIGAAAIAGLGCAGNPSEPGSSALPAKGTIAGRVHHISKLLDDSREPFADVFVYVKEGLEGRSFPAPAQPVVLDQVGFQFVPKVFGIMVGQTLKITSQDTSQHNVNCQSFKNPAFNENMLSGDVVEKRFTTPEVMVLIQCNIHHIMKAYAGVLSHPYHAVTGRDGAFEIEGLTPGRYVIEAWQEERGTRRATVTLGPDAGARIEFLYP